MEKENVDVAFAVKVLKDNIGDFEPLVQQAVFAVCDEVRRLLRANGNLIDDMLKLVNENNLLKYRYNLENSRAANEQLDIIPLRGEVWKDIEGYDGLYQVSNKGRVKSLKYGTPKILKGGFSRAYRVVQLSKEGTSKYILVHRLVATAFISNPQNKPVVNHIDGNRQNNCVENLEWVTQSENVQHTYKLGYTSVLRKLTPEQVREIRRDFKYRDKEFGGAALAKKYGVDAETIRWVVKNKIYKNVK